MVLELKFARFADQPWGFRLTGGADFERPLTVIKVTPNSIADKCGMKVDDVIVRINDTPASNLSHQEAHNIITKCGNTFLLALLRPDSETTIDPSQEVIDQLDEMENGTLDKESRLGKNGSKSPLFQPQIETPDSDAYSTMSEITINLPDSRPCTADITDEYIAEVMSGEAEVLKDHNVIGVNFNRIIPSVGIFKCSEVFKQLNEEAIKTKQDKDKEQQRWTTFLQKPNRPIPKSAKEIELNESRGEPYRVVIKKQPKPRCAPNRTPTPPPIDVSEEKTDIDIAIDSFTEDKSSPLLNEEFPSTEDVDELLEQTIGDNELPDLEATEPIDEQPIGSIETDEDILPHIEVDADDGVEKSEEELVLENKLADVQRQLLALSTLPLTIQATLDAVTKQLAELVPKLQDHYSSQNTDVKSTESLEAPIEAESVREISDTEEQAVEKLSESNSVSTDELEICNNVTDDKELPEDLTPEEQLEIQRMEKVFRKQEEEWMSKRQKEQRRLENELKQRIPANAEHRRLSKSTLTPQERPLVLPGGRKWRNERDAYNEEFIAEVISSQAELITGSTLGNTYESPLLGYDDRINFFKYKKPEKDLSNLDRSEVFKIIHNLEREPKHGIPARPEKIMAEEDLRNTPTSISCA